MDKEKKHINNEDHQTLQDYIDELAKIKLIDPNTLLRLHQNISQNHYTQSDIINSISDGLLDDLTIN